MTRSSSCHLLDILAEVPDPRHKKGKRLSFGLYPRFDCHRSDVGTIEVILP